MIFYILHFTFYNRGLRTHAHHQQTVVVASWGEKIFFWARIFSVYNMHSIGNLRANSLSAFLFLSVLSVFCDEFLDVTLT